MDTRLPNVPPPFTITVRWVTKYKCVIGGWEIWRCVKQEKVSCITYPRDKFKGTFAAILIPEEK